MSEQLVKAISDMQEDEALRLVQQLLDSAEDPDTVLRDCQAALQIVGDRFSRGEYYLPHLIMSGETVKNILNLMKPKLEGKTIPQSSHRRKGKVVLATVRGDVHNIGKDIVSFLLDANGFEVHDLGVDTSEQKFVQAISELKAQVVALSGLLTSAYDSMKTTVEAIEQAGQRDGVKIMIGGGTMDERVKDYVGADAFGFDAMAAVHLARQWLPEK